MRYLVLGDVHANAPALAAVVTDARRRGWDAVLFLGDLVGYYPYPNEAIAALRALEPDLALLGNHDALMLALADGEPADDLGAASTVTHVIARQLETVGADGLDYLRTLTANAAGEGWQAAHGAFRSPFEYLTTVQNAQGNLPFLEARVGIVGHTHVPKAFASITTGEGELWRTVEFHGPHAQYRVPPTARAFLNPGAVGQPRDGSPAAAYALYDDERQVFDVYRVEYDVSLVQQRVSESGYPAHLGVRLASGR